MATTWTSIANIALRRLGEKPITDLADAGKTAEACNSHYEQARDEVLCRWNWVCARHRTALTADSTAPDFGWDYRYALPSSPYCLRLLSIEDEPAYQLEGRYILTDDSDGLNITYVKRITDATELDPLLVKAIALRLALDIANWIRPTGVNAMGALEDEYETVVLKAKQLGACQDYSTDEQEISSDTGNAEWIDAGR